MLPFYERNEGLQFFSEGLQRTNFHELITVYLCDYYVNCRPISCRTVESDALGMGRTGTTRRRVGANCSPRSSAAGAPASPRARPRRRRAAPASSPKTTATSSSALPCMSRRVLQSPRRESQCVAVRGCRLLFDRASSSSAASSLPAGPIACAAVTRQAAVCVCRSSSSTAPSTC